VADDVDLTQAREESLLRFKLQEKRPEGPAPTGACHNCGDDVAEGMRWCSPECRDDWERRRNGLS
jgi:hypothetical protein